MHQPDQKSDCTIRKGENPNGSAIVPAENANVLPGNVIVLPENAILPSERVIIPVGKRKNHSGMPHNDVIPVSVSFLDLQGF